MVSNFIAIIGLLIKRFVYNYVIVFLKKNTTFLNHILKSYHISLNHNFFVISMIKFDLRTY